MDKLDIYSFGRQLIETGDLDPVYIVVHQAQLQPTDLCNWLLAYWCFYHCGTACWITDAKDVRSYWIRMQTAAASKDYARSSERRHFRGAAAISAIESLMLRKQTPSEIVAELAWGSKFNVNPALNEVMKRVQQLRNFGPWIAFKVADMLERLNIVPIVFSSSDVFNMFKAPREGAVMLADQEGRRFDGESEACSWAYAVLKRKLGLLKAPPRLERRINIQEIETILCKYHSHLGGHYILGKDIHEVEAGLEKYSKTSNLANYMIQAGSAGGLW